MDTRAARHRGFPITAFAAANGLGRTTRAVEDALFRGESGLSPCPLDVPFETVCGVIAGPLPDPPSELAAYRTRMTGLALLAYEDMRAPVERAIARHGADRVAMVLGTSTGGIAQTEIAYDAYKRTGALPDDFDYERQHPFFAFTDVMRRVTGIGGPRSIVSTACSSSAKVFATAERYLRAGIADAVLVGGIDTLAHTTVRGFHSLGVLSPVPCRPFGSERPGMNVGEGGAYALIERAGEGRARLLGVGESSDAFHMSAPDPEGNGARLAMERALSSAGLEPRDVDHLNAHGTGTARNDNAEALAIEKVFGTKLPVISTKGYTGHMLGAGGATEAIFCIMALGRQQIPASLGSDPIDPGVRIQVDAKGGAYRLDVVVSNSFAFGGNNASVVLGREA